MTRMKQFVLMVVCLCLLGGTGRANAQGAQAPRDGKLLVTVVDPTGAVLPGATVTVTGQEDATKTAGVAPLKATEKGLVTFENLVLGRYSVQAQFPGFELGLIRDVRVRSGENRHVIVLPLKKMEDSITVGRDKQEAAADRQASFGSAMTREQIEMLSDDPDEMRRQLQQIGGPDAVITVDSFEGQQLPPKAQIKSIRVTRDQFAAEQHFAGGISIEIITQPGIGPIRGSARMGFQDSALDGVNPLVAARGPAQMRSFGGSIGGTLIKDKSTFSISFNGSDSFSTPVQYAVTPDGLVAGNLAVRNPYDYQSFSGLLDYAVTKDQTIRIGVSRNGNSQSNLGIGGYEDISRAYATDGAGYSARAQLVGPVGRRFFLNTRFSLNWSDSEVHSTIEAPTVIVNDAFTTGGAQRDGGTHTRTFSIASDLDYVRGRHSVRTGILIDGSRYRTDSATNYLGTYTFSSLATFELGLPRSYTRRIGDPNIEYWNVQAGLYIQDDFKLRKNLTITPGLRYELQTHLNDYLNFAPRVGITWAPFASGATTLRASAGIFYDWLSTAVYDQTLRIDGFRQREINVINPSYPDPGNVDTALPTNRYLLDDELIMGQSLRVSLGASQRLNAMFTVGATYSDSRGDNLLVGRNLNAPVDRVRPDPTFANVVEARSLGRSVSRALSTYANINLAPAGPGAMPGAGGSAPRFVWRRGLSAYVSYNLNEAKNDTDGAFAIPVSNDLEAEWGPSSGDIRHRLNLSISTGMLRNFNASVNFYGNSAPPLTIRTGIDDNGDLVFNDRPEGVGRNSARTAGQWNSYAYFSYTIGFGRRTVPTQPGISITSMGGAVAVNTMAAQAAPRYRVTFGANVDNLLNRANYGGYSGIITSPLFLQPSSANGVRRVTFNASVSF